MDIEDNEFLFSDSFWNKSKVLFEHAKFKFEEIKLINTVICHFAAGLHSLSLYIKKIIKIPKNKIDFNSTSGIAISTYLNKISMYGEAFEKINKVIVDNQIRIKDIIETKERNATDSIDDLGNAENIKYQNELNLLKEKQDEYIYSVNEAVRALLNKETQFSGKDKYPEVSTSFREMFFKSLKDSKELEKEKLEKEKRERREKERKERKKIEKTLNIDEIIESRIETAKLRRKEYKEQVKLCNTARKNYIEVQGGLFAQEQKNEKEYADFLKDWLKIISNKSSEYLSPLIGDQKELEIIDNIDGNKDCKNFAEKNKSLITEPKRIIFSEYSQNVNYYFNNFPCLQEMGKEKNYISEYKNKLGPKVSELISKIKKEEEDLNEKKVLEIAQKMRNKDNISENEYHILIDIFSEQFKIYTEWKNNRNKGLVNYAGEEYDNRFKFIRIFLKYFNDTRVSNKELNQENYNYFCKIMYHILTVNQKKEDVSYNICDQVIILSSTFYVKDIQSKNGKKFVSENLKKHIFLQNENFWIGLTKHELTQEIQQQTNVVDNLDENISETKIKNSISAKIITVCFNLIQFIEDNNIFNKILKETFNYCQINTIERKNIIEMIKIQLKSEGIEYLNIDIDNLIEEEQKNEENKNQINEI